MRICLSLSRVHSRCAGKGCPHQSECWLRNRWPYVEYNPANFNPNVAYLPANTSGKTLSDNYFRPLPGLGALTYVNFSGSTNYNSLQGTVRRNMTKHLSYGLAYTLS